MKVTATAAGGGGGGTTTMSVLPVTWVDQSLSASPERSPVATAAASASGVPAPARTRRYTLVAGGTGVAVKCVSTVSPISSMSSNISSRLTCTA